MLWKSFTCTISSTITCIWTITHIICSTNSSIFTSRSTISELTIFTIKSSLRITYTDSWITISSSITIISTTIHHKRRDTSCRCFNVAWINSWRKEINWWMKKKNQTRIIIFFTNPKYSRRNRVQDKRTFIVRYKSDVESENFLIWTEIKFRISVRRKYWTLKKDLKYWIAQFDVILFPFPIIQLNNNVFS